MGEKLGAKERTSPVWLNIGCGDKQIPDPRWTNIDKREGPGISIVCDMRDVRDFIAEDSVDLIYSCHALEHLSHDQAMEALTAWASILKPQTGVLRICVPDMAFIAEAMSTWHTHLGRLRGLIWGGQNYDGNTHYTGWDYEELARDLRDCGYFNIVPYDPWDAMRPYVPPVFRDFSFMELDGRPCSLNVEAIAI